MPQEYHLGGLQIFGCACPRSTIWGIALYCVLHGLYTFIYVGQENRLTGQFLLPKSYRLGVFVIIVLGQEKPSGLSCFTAQELPSGRICYTCIRPGGPSGRTCAFDLLIYGVLHAGVWGLSENGTIKNVMIVWFPAGYSIFPGFEYFALHAPVEPSGWIAYILY